jgi:hypothetical protein
LVYFGGHGVQIEAESYLIPSKETITTRAAAKHRGYPLKEIIDNFGEVQNRLNLLIVDACRTDPFHRGGGGGLVTREAPPGLIVAFVAGSGRAAEDGLHTPLLLQRRKTPSLPIRKVFLLTRDDVNSHNKQQLPLTIDQASIEVDSWTILPRARGGTDRSTAPR